MPESIGACALKVEPARVFFHPSVYRTGCQKNGSKTHTPVASCAAV